MSLPEVILHGFAYGEHLEGIPPRSLGYRLLAPAAPEAWSTEVEALARRLQGAPYPDHWPPADLFCSVLLADGRRLVGVARYGLADHTSSQRRGGLELIGVVAPAGLTVSEALTIYRWLQQKRVQVDDLYTLSGRFALAEVLSATTPPSPPNDPVAVLPIRLWQEGVLLFAATAPSDPDHRLGLLEQGAGSTWQWLPLVGADFPLQSYAQRGSLVAWTPHLAGVALKLDRKAAEAPAPTRSRRRSVFAVMAVALLFALLAANLGAFLWLGSKVKAAGQAPAEGPPATEPRRANPDKPLSVSTTSSDDREKIAQALFALLSEQGVLSDWTTAQLLSRYEVIAKDQPNLRLLDSSKEGKQALGAVSLLARRSPKQVKEMIKKALTDKGYSPRLVEAACEDVYEHLTAGGKDSR